MKPPPLYGQTGFPLRSRVKVKDTNMVKREFRGKEGLIVYSLSDYSEQGYGYGYFVQIDKLDVMVFLEEYFVELISYPIPLQNWLRNKVKLLYEIDPRIAYQLGQEKYKGTGEGNYERDFPHVPLGDNK